MEHEQPNESSRSQPQSRSMIFHNDLTFIDSMPEQKDIEFRLNHFLSGLRKRKMDARNESLMPGCSPQLSPAGYSAVLQIVREAQNKLIREQKSKVKNTGLKTMEILKSGWRGLFRRFQRKPDLPDHSGLPNHPDLLKSLNLSGPYIASISRKPETQQLLSAGDMKRIQKRAARIYKKMKTSTGMELLSKQVRAQLLPLRDGLPVTKIETEHEADEIAARLHAEIPWMAPATEAVWRGLRASAREGLTGIRFEPLILVGSPGIGKSYWARRIAHHLSLPTTLIDATGEPGSFALVGTQKGWNTASPGKVVNTMLRERHGGPLVIIDEIEKAGEVRSNNGTRHTLTEALLPLLERMTAKNWECPFFQIRFDMSWSNWVMTANSRDGLPDFLQSRCVVLDLPDLTTGQLRAFAITEGRKRGLSEPAMESLGDVFDCETVSSTKLDLRSVNRMLDLAGHLEQGPMLH